MRLGIVQFTPGPEPSENLERARELLFSLGKVDLALLPELFTTGYHLDDLDERARWNLEALSVMEGWARELGAHIGATLALPAGGGIRNRFVLVGPKGLTHYQDKAHLFRPMREPELFRPGNFIGAFDTPFGQLGALICYELRFPEVARKLAKEGAWLLLVPALWPKERRDAWRLFLRARAAENQVYVAGANGFGGSALYDPFGEEVLAFGDGDLAAVAEILPEKLQEARSKIPVWDDRREELY